MINSWIHLAYKKADMTAIFIYLKSFHTAAVLFFTMLRPGPDHWAKSISKTVQARHQKKFLSVEAINQWNRLYMK